MLLKKILFIVIFTIISLNAFANTPKSTGKYKNWESFVAETDKGKICFAQTVPTKRAPLAIKRDKSKLFVTFRPTEDIKDEVSITSGHDYKSSTVTASSGKRKYSFFSQKSFAWLLDDQEEKKFIKLIFSIISSVNFTSIESIFSLSCSIDVASIILLVTNGLEFTNDCAS